MSKITSSPSLTKVSCHRALSDASQYRTYAGAPCRADVHIWDDEHDAGLLGGDDGIFHDQAVAPAVAFASHTGDIDRLVRPQRKGLPGLTLAVMQQHAVACRNTQTEASDRKDPLGLLMDPPEDEQVLNLDDTRPVGPTSRPRRTLSIDSMPSLADSASASDDSIITSRPLLSPSLTRGTLRAFSSSTTSAANDHPLRETDLDLDGLDYGIFDPPTSCNLFQSSTAQMSSVPSRRTIFKSHLIASLRVLKAAATSLSNFTAPALIPEDFLTRSILTIDPHLPFTDERMPRIEAHNATAADRRYLNPPFLEPETAISKATLAHKIPSTRCSTSIPLETYRIHRGRALDDVYVGHIEQKSGQTGLDGMPAPVARPREMRENSDFIRIAVMEMAMRRNGKLDDQKPGRARWALPPRQAPRHPDKIGADGVPIRWRAVSA